MLCFLAKTRVLKLINVIWSAWLFVHFDKLIRRSPGPLRGGGHPLKIKVTSGRFSPPPIGILIWTEESFGTTPHWTKSKSGLWDQLAFVTYVPNSEMGPKRTFD